MSKNFQLRTDAIKAIITNPDNDRAREGMVQPGECPAFNKGEVIQALDLKGECDIELFTAAFVLLHLSGGGCTYKFAKWAMVRVNDRRRSLKRRHYEACEEARRLGATDERLRGMTTDRILARNEEKIAERRAAFYSKMMSTVRSINVYEKAMRIKLTVVGVEPDATKPEMEARYADLQTLLLTVQDAATKPKAKTPTATVVAA